MFSSPTPALVGRIRKHLAPAILATSIGIFSTASAAAQSSDALVEALLRKGILTHEEAEGIQAEIKKEAGQSSANKIKLNNSITELKLYGDLRLRYQYDNKDAQVDPLGVGVSNSDEDRSPTGNQQSRWRFRLRLNADFKLGEDIFGGVELQTAIASDSGMQTFENGFSDYPIFISKAYLGWTPTDWLTLTAGKVPNPFFTTDLIWDQDINPTGVTEVIHFHKLFAGEESAATGYSKDGKAVVTKAPESPWELSLVAGQFIFDDNIEGGGRDNGTRDNDSTTDAYLFETQLVASYKFSKNTKLTIAPAWLTYINGSLGGVENSNPFNDNEFVSGGTRNLNLILAPGEFAFTAFGQKAKLYWDFSYNLEGRKRAENIYRLAGERTFENSDGSTSTRRYTDYSERDSFAWLAGFQIGENKKQGDWSLLANYRETGIAAVDPNLNESDFAQGELNTRGVRVSAGYNFTDFLVGVVSYGYAWNLRDDLRGGEATGGNAIADSNAIHVFQVDLNLKF